MSAHDTIAKLRHITETAPESWISRGAKGAITGTLNKAFGGDNMRKAALWYIFDADKYSAARMVNMKSTKELSEKQWYALNFWIDMYKDDEDNEWHVGEEFLTESSELRTMIEETVMRLDKQGLVSKDEFFGKVPESLVQEAKDEGGVVVRAWVDGTPKDVEDSFIEHKNTPESKLTALERMLELKRKRRQNA